MLRNGSGAVRKKIDDVFGHTLSTAEKCAMATLIYYPAEKIAEIKKNRARYGELVQDHIVSID